MTRPPSRRNHEPLGLVDGLVQLSMLVQDVLTQVAAAHDLSVLQARLIGVLRDREPSMAQLRELLDLDKSSTTGLVDRAERHDLVRRIPVPEDGRSFRVQLTETGRKQATEFVADVTAHIEALTEHLTDTNRHRLQLLASSLILNNATRQGIDLSVGRVD